MGGEEVAAGAVAGGDDGTINVAEGLAGVEAAASGLQEG